MRACLHACTHACLCVCTCVFEGVRVCTCADAACGKASPESWPPVAAADRHNALASAPACTHSCMHANMRACACVQTCSRSKAASLASDVQSADGGRKRSDSSSLCSASTSACHRHGHTQPTWGCLQNMPHVYTSARQCIGWVAVWAKGIKECSSVRTTWWPIANLQRLDRVLLHDCRARYLQLVRRARACAAVEQHATRHATQHYDRAPARPCVWRRL